MKYYSYVEPDQNELDTLTVVMSEAEIINDYWSYWADKMKSVGKEADINLENCIIDWCVIHWAIPEQVYKLNDRYFILDKFVDDDHFRILNEDLATLICVSDPDYTQDGFVKLSDLEEVDDWE